MLMSATINSSQSSITKVRPHAENNHQNQPSSDAGARSDRVGSNVVKLSVSCLKNWSAIASAIAYKKQLKRFYSRLYA